MARVTVEDCIEKLPNRFELVMVAAQRARRIGSGAQLTLDRDNDKNPVVALREIAEDTINTEQLKDDLIRAHQRVIPVEDEEEEKIEYMEGEKEWASIAANAAEDGFSSEDDDGENSDENEDNISASRDISLGDLAGLVGGNDDEF